MKAFETWHGVDVETSAPPSVRAEFAPHEFVHPRFRLEVDTGVFHLLQHLVGEALAMAGDDPSDQLLALNEALEALDG